MSNTDFYFENGYLLVKKLFARDEINNILEQAKNIYITQMVQLNMTDDINLTNIEYEKHMKTLFDTHFNVFLNCGKQAQHIIDLWKLSLDDRIINTVKSLKIQNPIISTRPVLFSNSKHISKTSMNHTVPPHQDWASMQSSINSIVCWLPLIDMNQTIGPVAVVPKTHKLGLLSKGKMNSFGLVEGFNDDEFVSFDVEQGDVLFFSSFLVHKSGDNVTDSIRWSTHFRYNDLDEKTFIDNGYPHAYIYKPIDDMLNPEFDTKTEAKKYFENITNV